MMESLFEFAFEGLYEIILSFWTKRMKKRNPNYDNNVFKKILMEIFKFIIVMATFVLGIMLIFAILMIFI